MIDRFDISHNSNDAGNSDRTNSNGNSNNRNADYINSKIFNVVFKKK